MNQRGMSPAAEALWRRYKERGDAAARAELLEQHLGLVHHVSRQIAERVGDALTYDDLVSAGTIGLVQALEAFEPARGNAFTTYALQRIRGAVLDELRAADWRPRSVRSRGRQISNATAALEARLGRKARPAEVAAELNIDVQTYFEWRSAFESGGKVSLESTGSDGEAGGFALADRIPDEQTPAPDAGIDRDEQTAALLEGMAQLPEQQRMVLSLSYYEELTLRQIAEILHVTESRISQIRTAALRTLRTRLTEEFAA